MLTHAILAAANQAWPPFVLVAGLLLIGAVAADDGLFEATGARLARSRLGPRGLLRRLLALVAAVTAVLNLDTAVLFLTPVLVHAARRRGPRRAPVPLRRSLHGERRVLAAAGLEPDEPARAAQRPAGGESRSRRGCSRRGSRPARSPRPSCASASLSAERVGARVGPLPAAPAASEPPRRSSPPCSSSSLPNPAVPVLVVGLAAIGAAAACGRVLTPACSRCCSWSPSVLGTLARLWHGPAKLLDSSGVWTAAGIGAAASVLVNNLPGDRSAHGPGARAPVRAAARARPRPQPRGDRLAFGRSLAAGRALRRRASLDRDVHQARHSSSCR